MSGTMGWEALLLDRPVYLLGRVFYRTLPEVRSVTGYDDLRARLAEDKAAGKDKRFGIDEDRLIKFLIAIKRQSFPGVFDVAKMDMQQRVLEPENIENVCAGIKEIIERSSGAFADTTVMQEGR